MNATQPIMSYQGEQFLAYNNGPPYQGNENTPSPEDQLNDLLRRAFDWFSNRGNGLYLLIIAALVLLWLSSGIYSIQAGEEGVVQTFGRFTSVTGPGLNYHFPRPFQRVTIVDVESIRLIEIGFRTTNSGRQDNLQEALMLTEDENIVQVELVVQYRVADSQDFVFNVQAPQDVLLTTAEVALRSTVGKMTIDAVITEERARVQEETRTELTRLMDDYGAGILITNVQLQVADPPEEVRDAFQEVVRALADKERLINVSQAYQNDVVPRARGEKQSVIESANAFRDQVVLRATGDADRFLAILEAYRIAPEVTRERMHIEALEQILKSVELTLIDKNALGDQVLPFLPLKGLESGAAAPAIVGAASGASTQDTEEGGTSD